MLFFNYFLRRGSFWFYKKLPDVSSDPCLCIAWDLLNSFCFKSSKKSFFKCSLVWNLTRKSRFIIIVLQARWRKEIPGNEESYQFSTKSLPNRPLLAPLWRAESTPMPSPRYSTPRWQKHSRPPLPEWSVPSAMPLRLPGTEAIWIRCKDFSGIQCPIPRENRRIRSLLRLLLTNCSFSWSPARLPISDCSSKHFGLFSFEWSVQQIFDSWVYLAKSMQ